MTISSTTNRVSYAGNGSTTTFNFPYYFIQEADLVVILRNNTTGVETVKTLTTDYSVAGEGLQIGGSITLLVAPITGESIIVYRDPERTQEMDLVENDALPAETLEASVDKLTMLTQRLSDRADRAVNLSEGYTAAFDTALPNLIEADAVLCINPTADGFIMGPTTTEIEEAEANAIAAAASAAAALVSENNADTSETNAAASAVAAAASAVAAQNAAQAIIWRDVIFKTFADTPITISATTDRGVLYSVDATGGNVVVNLPQVSALDLSSAWVIAFKKTDSSANAVTVNRGGSDLIDGATSKVLTLQNQGFVAVPDTDTTPDSWTTSEFGSTVIADGSIAPEMLEGGVAVPTVSQYYGTDGAGVFGFHDLTGGGGGGTASSIEFLATKTENENAAIFSAPLSNSLALSGAKIPKLFDFYGVLTEAYGGSGTTLKMLWSPIYPNPADPDLDSAAGWTAVTDAASITTSATAKVGAASLQWTKTTGSTASEVEYDRGDLSLSIANHLKHKYWFNIANASLINLGGGGIYMRVFDTIGGTKYLTKTTTTQAGGAAFANGWNELEFDFSTGVIASGGATINDIFSSTRFGFITNNAADAPTVLIDGGMGGYSPGDAQLGFKGAQLSIYDGTNKEQLIFPSASASSGIMTLASALTNTYAAGSATRVKRSMLLFAAGEMAMDATLTGAAALSQEVRHAVLFRSAAAGDFGVIADVTTPQYYPVKAVGGGSIDLTDTIDTSANVLNTNVLHIFRPSYVDGETYFTYVQDITASGNSTWGTDTLTVPCTPGSVAVNDIAIKKHIVASVSTVAAATTNESYTTLTPDASPEGIRLFNGGIAIPNEPFTQGLWPIGARNPDFALRNKKGPRSGLTMVGSVNTGVPFPRGLYGAGPFTSADYLRLSIGESGGMEALTGTNPVSGEFLSIITNLAVDGIVVSNTGAGNAGWFVAYVAALGTFGIYHNNVLVTTGGVPVVAGDVNSVTFTLRGVGNACDLYVNGVFSTATGSAISANNNFVKVGNDTTGQALVAGYVSQLLLQANGPAISATHARQVYAGGATNVLGVNPMLRYKYTAAAQAGLKHTVKGQLLTETTDVTPAVQKFISISV